MHTVAKAVAAGTQIKAIPSREPQASESKMLYKWQKIGAVLAMEDWIYVDESKIEEDTKVSINTNLENGDTVVQMIQF